MVRTRPPWLVYLFFALIVIGPIAVARWSSLDELVADRRTLAEAADLTDRRLGLAPPVGLVIRLGLGLTTCHRRGDSRGCRVG
jgi:hypothetical protein